jgi:hypothetical protein
MHVCVKFQLASGTHVLDVGAHAFEQGLNGFYYVLLTADHNRQSSLARANISTRDWGID